MTPLPIDSHLPEIVRRLEAAKSLVIVAEPGAGKTTRVPPAILRSGLLSQEHPNLVILQPRRVAARAAAQRIADENGWEIGREVGYQIRFEKRIGKDTRLRVLTEGVLTRRMLDDPFLEGVGAVVLDEFHERSLTVDLAIAMLREMRQTVRDDLLLIVMSATLEAEPAARFPWRLSRGERAGAHIWRGDRISPAGAFADRAACGRRGGGCRRPSQIGRGYPGLPSRRGGNPPSRARTPIRRREIRSGDFPAAWQPPARAADAGPSAVRSAKSDSRHQHRGNFADHRWRAMGDRQRIGPRAGVRSTARAGPAGVEANQQGVGRPTRRPGRAHEPGTCLRLWSAKEQAALDDFELPEIQRVDLSGAVLDVYAWGKADASAFDWFESPPMAALESAQRLLEMLAAVERKRSDADGSTIDFAAAAPADRPAAVRRRRRGVCRRRRGAGRPALGKRHSPGRISAQPPRSPRPGRRRATAIFSSAWRIWPKPSGITSRRICSIAESIQSPPGKSSKVRDALRRIARSDRDREMPPMFGHPMKRF